MAKSSKILLIVESPGKIKKISTYLGTGFVVRASFGHVMDLITGDRKCRLGVNIEKEYEPKYRILPDKKDKIQAIIDAAASAKQIYLATDPDREGEAIAWHLQNCLESSGKPIKRITFNEITKSAIDTAIKNPGPLNKDLFDAQQARRVLDRIVGFLGSDFLRDAIGPNLSAGRVQSVAARLVVDREREIESFVPEEYWNITATLAKPESDAEKFVAKYDKKVTNEKDAKKVKADLDKDDYEVIKVDAKEKKRNPWPPLITKTLQQTASAKYGYSGKKTMRCAQSLYESGLITYMRTDSVRCSPDSIKEVRDYLNKNNYNMPAKPNVYLTKGSAQDAHEAIRPTDVFKTPQNVFLSDEDQKIYRIIWERFVASQMKPALYDTVSVTIRSSSGHTLKANGRTLKFDGWLVIIPDQKKSKDDKDVPLPPLVVGDKLILVPPKVLAEQKFTKPPVRYTETSLNDELDKRGIGRPSTYVQIHETIKGRNYVTMQGKSYHATDIGKQVIDKLTDHFQFMNYTYTSDMELKLDKIADGNLGYVDMLDAFFIPFQKECKDAESAEAPDYGIACPECGKKTLMKHGQFGFYMSCIDRPKCKGSLSVDVVDGCPKVREKFKKEIVPGVQCPKCGSGMWLNTAGRFGPFYSCETYPKCKGTAKVPYGKKCPDCGCELFMTIFSGQKKLACMGYPSCRHVENLPGDDKSGWTNPAPYRKKKKKKSVQKVLDASRKKKAKKIK